MKPLSRKEIREGLSQVPMEDLLIVSKKSLTSKQKNFARELAMGSTKADAYRKAYKKDATKNTLASKPYILARDERIKLEREHFEMAIEGAKHRTPALLRELVIQSLVQVLIDPEAKHATKVQASKVLGTVTEVSAFTERKEIRTITSSEDTKAKIMEQLKVLMRGEADDVTFVEADTLLKELASDTHSLPTPRWPQQESQDILHTIPLEPTQQESDLVNPPHDDSESDPHPSENQTGATPPHPFREDPP
jgi:hypothetical protein